MPLNDSNFLMWFPAAETAFMTPLPRPFVREPEMLSPVVWVVPGDVLQVYVNAINNTAPIIGPVQIQYGNNSAVDTLSALQAFAFPNGTHSYGTITMPLNASEGFVRLIANGYTTQWLWMTTAEKAAVYTVDLQFGNSERLQNIRYGYLPDGWKQRFRVRLQVRSEEPTSDKTVYTESTTGKRRHLYSEPGWIVNLIAPEFDRWGHRAMASLMEHDAIIMNGNPYSYESAYKANTTIGDALSDGECSLRDENYSTLHRS